MASYGCHSSIPFAEDFWRRDDYFKGAAGGQGSALSENGPGGNPNHRTGTRWFQLKA